MLKYFRAESSDTGTTSQTWEIFVCWRARQILKMVVGKLELGYKPHRKGGIKDGAVECWLELKGLSRGDHTSCSWD